MSSTDLELEDNSEEHRARVPDVVINAVDTVIKRLFVSQMGEAIHIVVAMDVMPPTLVHVEEVWGTKALYCYQEEVWGDWVSLSNPTGWLELLQFLSIK